MKLSDNGLALLKTLEGCILTPYKDQGGTWTDGYGNTTNVVPGCSISQDEADAQLISNVMDIEAAVSRLVKVDLNQDQFDALVLFTYNEGPERLRTSTLLCMLNAGNYSDAAEQFSVWTKCRGVTDLGLVRRRALEQSLFMSAQTTSA